MQSTVGAWLARDDTHEIAIAGKPCSYEKEVLPEQFLKLFNRQRLAMQIPLIKVAAPANGAEILFILFPLTVKVGLAVEVLVKPEAEEVSSLIPWN